jgi:iron complex transport system substrate-binding protein
VGSGLLAGCAGDSGPASNPTETDDTTTAERETAESDTSYEVCMEPAGCVTFEETPTRWVSRTRDYADIGIALGMADGFLATGWPGWAPQHLYDQLPGVHVDWDSVISLGDREWDKELFFEMDADVHLMDPNPMISGGAAWSEADIEEVSENVGPIIGNYSRETSSQADRGYRFYTMYEAFEKVAEIFQRTDRYEAFATLHDEVLQDVTSRLPPEDERPSVATTYAPPDIDGFSVREIDVGGFQRKHFRDLELVDAFEGMYPDGSRALSTDYEGMLEVDPDVILIFGWDDISEADFESKYVEPMRDHPVGSELTAVQNDRVYSAGSQDQGPTWHLFNLEAAAKAVYPDTFGELENRTTVPDEPLFDRQRLADIINGDR